MRFQALSGAILLVAGHALAGCGAAQPKQAGDENNFDTPPTSSAEPAVKWSDKASSRTRDDSLDADQKKQMEIALFRGGKKAAQCMAVADDAKPGKGEVKVTFNGTVGRITEVVVGPPWAGIPHVEACIKNAFLKEYSLRFDGELEVPYTVELLPNAAAVDPKAKPPKK